MCSGGNRDLTDAYCIAVELTAVFCVAAVSSGCLGQHWKLVSLSCHLSIHVANH